MRRTRRQARGVIAVILALAPLGVLARGTRVQVELPVPPRINTRAIKTILVAQFVATNHRNVDTGREFVRFVKRELAKGTSFVVLDVDPPALPEQPIEDLLKNATFWKHIAEEFGADLVVSGRISYTTNDRSGFVQEDIISPVTGQKVRRARFLEREEFVLDSGLWFFKGANGAFLYEDSFRNRQIYEGKSNDPLQIFYNLTERLVPDLLGVVTMQKRQEPRTIFDE